VEGKFLGNFIQSSQEVVVPLKSLAETGASALADALELAGLVKLPADLAVAGFSSVICGLNY
jgi:hypothetical protein